MSAFITIILILSLYIWISWPHAPSDDEIELHFTARADFTDEWSSKYPGKEEEIESFLKLFCFCFWLSEEHWFCLSVSDDINVIYDLYYSEKWYQFGAPDCLEHYTFTTELESETGRHLPTDVLHSIETIGQCFELFYVDEYKTIE